MNQSKPSHWAKSVGAISGALVLGLTVGIAGVVYAGDNTKRNADIESFAAGKYAEELPPLVTLKNGKTAGAYRAETPLDDRPDYLVVTLKDGQEAFVMLEDTFTPPVVPLGTKGPIEITEKEARDTKAAEDRLLAKANEKGEIWVNAYADDGTTVIGQWLMGHK